MRRVVVRMTLDLMPLRIQRHHPDAARRQGSVKRGLQVFLGQHHARGAASRQHVFQTVARIAGIKRHVSAAGFENTQERDHHFQAALDAYPYQLIRRHTLRAQVMRQPVRAAVQLGIRELAVLIGQRDGIGARLHSIFDEMVD